jgi:structural maintenance of chromosome 1
VFLGKSNLMDAISFVLGINSNQLRSSQLVDLINRKSGNELKTNVINSGTKKRTIKEVGARKTVVSAFYENSNGKSVIFSRR